MRNILIHLFIMSLISCSTPIRYLASGPVVPPALDDLLKASEIIYEDITDPRFDSLTCVSYLSQLEKNIDELDLKLIPKETLESQGKQIASNVWKIRKTLHSQLSDYDKNCVYQLQSSFRQFRFIEEYLLEIANHVVHLSPSEIDFQNQPIPVLDQSPTYYVLQSDQQGTPQFHAGDMLVTRGVSFLSSMIARLGKRGTQFSHIVFVHQDPSTQKVQTIESYVGVGVAFYEMDFALKNENARILWLRSKDQDMAKLASQKISDLVKKRLDEKRPIKYDYELNFDDPSTMSCAEVSQVAFEMASDKKMRLPYYPNTIEGARSLTSRLKIPQGATYVPGDMEIDPRFELVAEFRDLRLTRDSRQKDAVMTAIFQWMDKDNYELNDNFKSKMAGGLIYDIRRTFLWPLVKRMMKLDDFSKEIPRNMIRTVTLVNELGEQLQAQLKNKDREFEKKYGIPMGQMDLYQALEEIRLEDLKLYQNKKTRKKSKFHKMFRPKN